MALFDMIAFAMASDTKKAEFIRASMITSIQSVLNMLDPLIFDPLIFSDKTVHIIMNHFDEKQYELVLWKVTHVLEFCVSEREKARLGRLLVESWQHVISFLEMRLKDDGEAEHTREERKLMIISCQEGTRQVQRSLDETAALQMLQKHLYYLMRTLNEHTLRQIHEVKDDIQHGYFTDALFKLSISPSVVKVEYRLVLLKNAWEKLYELNKYRVDHIEEICRERYFGGESDCNACIILDEKRQDIRGCEEGLQMVEACYKALVEAKGRPWWHWLTKSDPSTSTKEQ